MLLIFVKKKRAKRKIFFPFSFQRRRSYFAFHIFRICKREKQEECLLVARAAKQRSTESTFFSCFLHWTSIRFNIFWFHIVERTSSERLSIASILKQFLFSYQRIEKFEVIIGRNTKVIFHPKKNNNIFFRFIFYRDFFSVQRHSTSLVWWKIYCEQVQKIRFFEIYQL